MHNLLDILYDWPTGRKANLCTKDLIVNTHFSAKNSQKIQDVKAKVVIITYLVVDTW